VEDRDREPIVAIAVLAALSDGTHGAEEQAEIEATAARLGLASGARAGAPAAGLAELAGRLSSEEARRAAYHTALAVCHADGVATDAEQRFLAALRDALGLGAAARDADRSADALARTPVALLPAETASSEAALDELIATQAKFTAALELLPDKLANVAILPLQLRLVHRIGQHYGRELDAAQVKDLAATLGIGAAAQIVESVARKVLGGIAGGLFGGVAGGATGLAAGAAVTFSATWALGHAAKQYYAQGRRLSQEDLRALFARFQEEGKALFPRLQREIEVQSRSLDAGALLRSLRGS
jgi:uncharacterized protein (DUF697 family)